MRAFAKKLTVLALLTLPVLSIGQTTKPTPEPPRPTPAIQKLINEANSLPEKDRLAAMESVISKAIAAKDLAGEAWANGWGGNYASRARKLKEAFDLDHRAVVLFRAIGDRNSEALSLSNIGSVYQQFSQPSKALKYFEMALSIAQAIGNRAVEAVVLLDLGADDQILGQSSKALDNYQRALSIDREIGNKPGEARALGSLGAIDESLGEYSKALDFFWKAVKIQLDLVDKEGVETTVTNIAAVYNDLGQYDKALNYFQQALTIGREAGDKDGEATTLNDMGLAYADLGQTAKALDCYQQALPIRKEIGAKAGEASTLSNIGTVYGQLGQMQKALDYYKQALPILKSIGQANTEATILSNIGAAEDSLGQKSKAVAFTQQALRVLREIGYRDGEAITCTQMERIESTENPVLAVWYGKRAVNLYQSLRNGISSLDKETQRVYKDSVASAYRELADLLARQGRLGEAERVLRLLKEDELYDYVRRSETSLVAGRTDYTPAEAAWDKDYEALTDDLAELARQVEDLKQSQADDAKLDKLADELAQKEASFKEFLDRVVAKSKRIGVQSYRTERIANAEGISQTLADMASSGVKDIAAVYALAAPDRLTLFYFSRGVAIGRVSPIKSADLDRKILAFREALTDPESDPRPLGKELYEILVKPIEKDLAGSRATRIMWSLDGQLRYIPLAALYDGKQFLAEKYDLSIFNPANPSESAALEKASPAQWRGLAAGVSQPHDLKDEDGTTHHFAALTEVPEELAGVQKAVPGTTELLDQNFTAESLRHALNRSPTLVHVATHFSFRPGDETKSYLLTGDGQPFRVADTGALSTVSFQGVSLLTLSACETALGGESSDGSEVESISVVLQRKGAESVLATLWQVDDSSTALLMAEFYRLRESHPEWTKIHALQAAQIEMLKGQLSDSKSASQRGGSTDQKKKETTGPRWPKALPKYSHPYYWAPFVLSGNWK